MDELKDHITSVQTVDAEIGKKLQSDAVKRARESSREIAEDIAQDTVNLYLQKQRASTNRAYTIGLAGSLSLFSLALVWIAGGF